MKSLHEHLEALNKELRSKFDRNLTQDELTQLQRVNVDIQQLRISNGRLAIERAELEQQKTMFELELFQNLHMRRDQLKAEVVEQNLSSEDTDLSTIESSLREIHEKIEEDEEKLQEVENELEEIETELNAKEKECTTLQVS